jgi:hypothetical protein
MRKGGGMRKSGMRRRHSSRNKRGGGVDIDLEMLKTKISGNSLSLNGPGEYFISYNTESNSPMLGYNTDITCSNISGLTFEPDNNSLLVQCLDGTETTETTISNINKESNKILTECSKELEL